MQLFADFVQPITAWLYSHPHWALAITFLISFSESLAIIGSIVPGSVTMTAIGILAGSGVMRIDLTLVAATAGAIMGDSASYFMGYYFSDHISEVWPFKRYPQVLLFGKRYFEQHGGKSVLIGRFAGPLRAVIPVIAGMMRMNQKRFLSANIISAIGWSVLYVMPGVLIGAASSDLSAETATRLFLIILAAIFLFWMLGFLLRWLIQAINIFLEKHFHYFWKFTARHPGLQNIIHFITPEYETNHYPTVFLILSILFSFTALTVTAVLVHNGGWLTHLNTSLHYFFTSLRSNIFDIIFSIFIFSYSSTTLASIAILFSFLAIRVRQQRLLRYWIVAIASPLLVCGALNNIIVTPHPSGNYLSHIGSSFPATPLAIMISMISFSTLLLIKNMNNWHAYVYRYFSLAISILACFSCLYLGDYWFSDVMAAIFAGVFCSLVTYLFYRRKVLNESINANWITLIIISWSVVIMLESFFNLQQSMLEHQIVFTKKTITLSQWKNQNENTLPRYRNNRLGLPVDLINIQYIGSLSTIEKQLIALGWKPVNKSFWKVVLEQMKDSDTALRLPILTQLYQNKKPRLIMVRKFNKYYFIIRFWESSYSIKPSGEKIFFASLHPHPHIKKTPIKASELTAFLSKIIDDLQVNSSTSPFEIISKKKIEPFSTIYLIKEKD